VSEPLAWRKSRRSAGEGNCVEVAPLPEGGYALRDSKDRQGPALKLSPDQWRRFTARLKG
jgi:hypothetical protein